MCRKINISQRGPSMVFVQKLNFFLCLFFAVIRSQKIMFFYSREKKKKNFTRKVNFQKVQPNRYFPQVQSMVSLCFLSKNQTFSYVCFFVVIISKKIMFLRYSRTKKRLSRLHKKSSKSRKIDIFPKGLTHNLGPKIAIFPTFFQAIQARKVTFTIFQNEKTNFQAIKTRSSKTRKIAIF